MKIKAIKTRVFKENEDLISFIIKYLPRLPEKSVLVVASKIVALAEGRVVENKGKNAKGKLIKKESTLAVPGKYVWLTIKDGMIMADAGIDESNAGGKLILLPKDSFDSARRLRRALKKHYGLKNIGIIISDSRTLPLRRGIIGLAIGYAGFQGLKDYRKKLDIFQRPYKYSTVDVADGLAASAILLMGEGNERQPLAVIENAPIVFQDRVNRRELDIAIADDLYGPLFGKILQKKRR